MNTGLQDAHNLAWKLTLASRGIAMRRLLDSYSKRSGGRSGSMSSNRRAAR